MALYFPGSVMQRSSVSPQKEGPSGSPMKEGPSVDQSNQSSLGLSLLSSPDSSYSCYSVNPVTGSPCCCRRSPRLLNNGYYVLTEDSYSWDDLGNVSLTPSKINVSYKENLQRIFRRRRRARRSLSSLLSDMTETCQSWLGDKVFGVGRPSPLAESSWIDHSFTELDSSCSFSYDHTEILSPPGKLPDEPLPQEEICTETCHSQEQVTQCVGGLSEVPPPTAFCCCAPPQPQPAGLSMVKALLLLSLLVCVCTVVYSRCLFLGLTVAFITLVLIMSSLYLTGSGPTGTWRKAKTEDITSRNE